MSWKKHLAVWVVLSCAWTGCSQTAQESNVDLDVPAWSHDVVWYQIFVERFRNGDPSNDPTMHDIEGSWPFMDPEGWAPTPWTQDWFRQEDWAVASGEEFYRTVQMRRYGGDLQGVLDKLDYLEELGVTALYFNPINDSPSLHKYDARSYRHVDRNFGPDPRGDEAIAAAEDPADPSTWQWTSADRQFLELVDAVHARGMRLIMDYSWNHTGSTFWAWKDVLEKQQDSPFATWYDVASFDDPATPDTNEFYYHGWVGVKTLPETREVGTGGETRGVFEGDLDPSFKQHVLAVTRRWMDPNGDGDPSDGVDGFRLDVAESVPFGFWRDYRRFVRSINPEAYLVGEVWWEEWPHHMTDPGPWLQGDVFDAVMNYRWYMPTRSYFAQAPPNLSTTGYIAHLDSVQQGFGPEFMKAMMNLGASHDTPRLGTSLYNGGLYKYQKSPRGNPEFKVDRPDARTDEVRQMLLLQQFTYPGAPHIWMGDEVGMWGGDDPDPRKPLVWADLTYEDETTHPFGEARRHDKVEVNEPLLDYYKQLIALRKEHIRLWVDGALSYLVADDDHRLLGYERVWEDQRAVVLFNASDEARTVTASVPDGDYRQVVPGGDGITVEGGALTAQMPPRTGMLWFQE